MQDILRFIDLTINQFEIDLALIEYLDLEMLNEAGAHLGQIN